MRISRQVLFLAPGIVSDQRVQVEAKDGEHNHSVKEEIGPTEELFVGLGPKTQHHQADGEADSSSGNQDLCPRLSDCGGHDKFPLLVFWEEERIDAEKQRVVINGHDGDDESRKGLHPNHKGDQN